MTDHEILLLAASFGFEAALIPPADIPVEPAYRAYCAENRCGQYNANYSCPPNCGSVEAMHGSLLREEKALILTSVWDIESYLDAAGIRKGAVTHNMQTLRLLARLRGAGFDGFAVGGGNCTLCTPCAMLSGEPCAHPAERFSCMSAYCVDVAKLAERCGLEFVWDPAKLHSFGMILFHEK